FWKMREPRQVCLPKSNSIKDWALAKTIASTARTGTIASTEWEATTGVFDSDRRYRRKDFGTDEITDFVVGEDKIVLSGDTFTTVLSGAGSVLQEFEVVGSNAAARSSNGIIVYNEETGDLFYNQNGSRSGLGSGGVFANLDKGLALQGSDFAIV
ncbi:MAG: hypothetical protein SXA11_18140, partial [Cyanobacteriota bacterium]|nr:hypothetical protein [Cyanobacteriota bacterium]